MSNTARKAIRRFCLDCQGGYSPSVRACADVVCVLHPLRQGSVGADQEEHPQCALPGLPQTLSPEFADGSRPERVIRLFCLACAGNRQEVRSCDAKETCALWSFRFGVSPATFKRVVARRQRWRTTLTLPGLPR